MTKNDCSVISYIDEECSCVRTFKYWYLGAAQQKVEALKKLGYKYVWCFKNNRQV